MKDNHFHEEQKFTQWWLWLPMIGFGGFLIYGLYQQVILKQPFGSNPAPDIGLLLTCLLFIAMLLLFKVIKLTTKLNSEGIRIRFFPFVNKSISWDEIESAKIVNYGFVGGYGIRLWTRYGTVYNIKGKMGLALELKNGKKLLVGTQKQEELAMQIPAQYQSQDSDSE